MNIRRSAPALAAIVLILGFGGCKSGSGSAERNEGQRGIDTSTTTPSIGGRGADDSVQVTTSVAGGAATTGVTRSGAGTGGAGDGTAAANGADSDPNLIEVTVSGGVVEGGVQTRAVKTGAQVTLRVTSDTSDVLHVQGYDLRVDVVAGQSTDLTFLAKSSGSFRVELEKQGKVLDLQVRP